ncbi:diacylglycerol/lipid kinase family protein [Sutcliffiella deserti]|uniref:diacylglycerol/lipid kinase family protein n=1 Tax=Sutcliffiella deserti TaxID=2875501 RepID=UPI001CBCF3A5|nr:diacylglycerol kinase family protein [Sutcliffiella deserti]
MYYFIVNKTSGNGKGWEIWTSVKEMLEKENIPFYVAFTKGTEEDLHIVDALTLSSIKAIVVVGGDGTIHSVANSIVKKSVPLGIIPAGSGNDFARSLNIPMNYKSAWNRILSESVKKIDMGKIGDKYYLTIAGIGFDGKVAQVTNQSKMKKWFNRMNLGKLSYVYSIIKVLLTYRPTSVTLHVDGLEKKFEKVWLVSVANLPFYGGGIKICPDAKANDGYLDLCIVHGVGRWELLMVFPRAFSGGHTTHKNVTMLRGKEVRIASDEKMEVQCDGEILNQIQVTISIEKDALIIF